MLPHLILLQTLLVRANKLKLESMASTTLIEMALYILMPKAKNLIRVLLYLNINFNF
jgi:hypothetical protein